MFSSETAGQAIVHIKRLRDMPDTFLPKPATSHAAGADLRAALDSERIVIAAGDRAPIPTGIAMEITRPGLAGFIFSRSGLGAREGLTVAQGVGLIDPDYRGELIVWLLNTSNVPQTILHGDRIAQLVILPYFPGCFVDTETLSDTDRGAGGFGHTGLK